MAHIEVEKLCKTINKSIKRLVVAGIVSVLVVANSIIAFASSHDFDGYAGSCHYSYVSLIPPKLFFRFFFRSSRIETYVKQSIKV